MSSIKYKHDLPLAICQACAEEYINNRMKESIKIFLDKLPRPLTKPEITGGLLILDILEGLMKFNNSTNIHAIQISILKESILAAKELHHEY